LIPGGRPPPEVHRLPSNQQPLPPSLFSRPPPFFYGTIRVSCGNKIASLLRFEKPKVYSFSGAGAAIPLISPSLLGLRGKIALGSPPFLLLVDSFFSLQAHSFALFQNPRGLFWALFFADALRVRVAQTAPGLDRLFLSCSSPFRRGRCQLARNPLKWPLLRGDLPFLTIQVVLFNIVGPGLKPRGPAGFGHASFKRLCSFFNFEWRPRRPPFKNGGVSNFCLQEPPPFSLRFCSFPSFSLLNPGGGKDFTQAIRTLASDSGSPFLASLKRVRESVPLFPRLYPPLPK